MSLSIDGWVRSDLQLDWFCPFILDNLKVLTQIGSLKSMFCMDFLLRLLEKDSNSTDLRVSEKPQHQSLLREF